jgi:hypothetical protein
MTVNLLKIYNMEGQAYALTYGITQNGWVCGLFPSSGILITKKYNVSKNGFVSIVK